MDNIFKRSEYNNNYILEVVSNNEEFNIKKTYNGDAGIDIPLAEDIRIPPLESRMIDFKISTRMHIDGKYVSYYMYLRSKIGKVNVILLNSVGIIDSGYTGSLRAYVYNLNPNKTILFEKGDSIVQLCAPNLGSINVVMVNEHVVTQRGELGFGSTDN